MSGYYIVGVWEPGSYEIFVSTFATIEDAKQAVIDHSGSDRVTFYDMPDGSITGHVWQVVERRLFLKPPGGERIITDREFIEEVTEKVTKSYLITRYETEGA